MPPPAEQAACLSLFKNKYGNSLFFFFAVPFGLWNLSSLTRDQTYAPAVEAGSLNQQATREVPLFWLL